MTNAEIYEQAKKDAAGKAYAPSPVDCPKCGEECPPCDWVEVDIGVGVQVGNEEWICLTHGVFGVGSDMRYVFQDDEADPR